MHILIRVELGHIFLPKPYLVFENFNQTQTDSNRRVYYPKPSMVQKQIHQLNGSSR